MRINQPITQREFTFAAVKTLVSVTDAKGRITYCNDSFVEVSGFERDELLGQPHNIVRHPDMPAEAFRDMWATIQSGRPWSGIVKNRRKNGDHYWVQANATPMTDAGRITGFLSVRIHPPSRAAITAAESLYARMNRESADGRRLHALRNGKVVRTDLVGRLAQASKLGDRARLFAIQVMIFALWGAAARLGGTAVALMAATPLAALGSWLAWRTVARPVLAVVGDANQLAAGDLSLRIDGTAGGSAGDLQRALGQLSLNLRTVVADTRTEVEAVRVAAEEIAAGNQDLSARTESQAASLQQTAASMEQINGSAASGADTAARGARLAEEAAAAARRCGEAVEAAAAAMASIEQGSRRIEDITQVVEGISFQTNLLALNAAVEAARAGPAGRGFAVVATEVRALAQRSSTSARDIKDLVSTSSLLVAEGGAKAAEARKRVDEALRLVVDVSSTLDGIRVSTAEQQTGIAQVNEAVSQMDSITQRNAALVEQLAAAAQSLRARVESVHGSMALFRLAPGEATVAEQDAVALRRAAKASAANPREPEATTDSIGRAREGRPFRAVAI